MAKGRRLCLRALAALTAGAGLLLLAAPAWAQEGQPGGTYASRFLQTDNALGTALIWMCLVISVAIFALILQNALQNRAGAYMPPDLVENLDRLLAEKNFREAIDLASNDPSPFARVIQNALAEAPRGYAAMEVAVEDTAELIGNGRVRRLVWLELAGAAGPMIGLFGTVFGMIISFYQLVTLGGQPKPAELAGGIATALVCTWWGLIVGIPGVIAGSLFRVMVEGRTADAIARAKQMLASFRPGAAKRPAPPPAGGAAGPKPIPTA